MPKAMDRFRELTASGGIKVALVRGASRLLDLTGQRLQTASRRLVDPATMEARLPAALVDQLACNKAFRGKYRGQRVVLLASGESSAKLDRQSLLDRPVIAVNEMFRTVIAAGLPLAAIVIHDSVYFDGSPATSKMLEDATRAAHEAGALVVIPAESARQLIVSQKLVPHRTLTFFESGRAVYDLPRPAHVLDMATVIPSLPTVAHAALVAAIYLGYSEVAILGVDLRYISHPNSPIAHAYGANPYVAALDMQTAAEAYLRTQGWAWPAVLRHVASQLEAYSWLAEGAVSQGQRIVNLSRDSLLSTVSAIDQAYA
jgi:hypothetical protein